MPDFSFHLPPSTLHLTPYTVDRPDRSQSFFSSLQPPARFRLSKRPIDRLPDCLALFQVLLDPSRSQPFLLTNPAPPSPRIATNASPVIQSSITPSLSFSRLTVASVGLVSLFPNHATPYWDLARKSLLSTTHSLLHLSSITSFLPITESIKSYRTQSAQKRSIREISNR